jgi:hypothetical protein
MYVVVIGVYTNQCDQRAREEMSLTDLIKMVTASYDGVLFTSIL